MKKKWIIEFEVDEGFYFPAFVGTFQANYENIRLVEVHKPKKKELMKHI